MTGEPSKAPDERRVGFRLPHPVAKHSEGGDQLLRAASRRRPPGGESRDFGEYPRIAESAATDHHAVACAARKALERLLGSYDVAASYDGDAERVAHAANDVPVCAAAIKLQSCTTVNRDHGRTCALDPFSYVYRIDARVVPTGADLHRHGNSNGFDDGGHHRSQVIRRAEQLSPPAPPHHFRRRTAAVDVDDVGAGLFDHPRSEHHSIEIGTEDLDRDGSLTREEAEHAEGLRVLPRESFCRDELTHQQTDRVAAAVLDHAAKRGIGHAGHRRENEIVSGGDAPDFERTDEHLTHGREPWKPRPRSRRGRRPRLCAWIETCNRVP